MEITHNAKYAKRFHGMPVMFVRGNDPPWRAILLVDDGDIYIMQNYLDGSSPGYNYLVTLQEKYGGNYMYYVMSLTDKDGLGELIERITPVPGADPATWLREPQPTED